MVCAEGKGVLWWRGGWLGKHARARASWAKLVRLPGIVGREEYAVK